ncbi:MAG: type II toxin-antitoxin system RelE/ParE family toxin [Luteimonas sp.]|nr:type II toxin-antitoxin system RelE/ParE family toxin [Luteimonas sp.]
MSNASNGEDTGAGPWNERYPSWIAALGSALLHVVCLLIAIFAPAPVVAPPQGAGSGSWVQVEFIGETRDADQRPPTPPPGAADKAFAEQRPAPAPPAAARIQSTPVPQAEEQVHPDRANLPAQPADSPRTEPSASRDSAAPRPSRAPASNPSPTPRRRPEAWGQPPGLVVQQLAPDDASPTHGPARSRGHRNEPAPDAPSLELGGYQVYYDLSSETQLRKWRDAGMTEIFIPLPGTRRYMVCPLEIALRRDSGKCRPLDPEDPGMHAIGDARKVIRVMQVYRQGELLWRGPGPYR